MLNWSVTIKERVSKFEKHYHYHFCLADGNVSNPQILNGTCSDENIGDGNMS